MSNEEKVVDAVNETEEQTVLRELNEVLTKYNYALVPKVLPKLDLIKLDKQDEPTGEDTEVSSGDEAESEDTGSDESPDTAG